MGLLSDKVVPLFGTCFCGPLAPRRRDENDSRKPSFDSRKRSVASARRPRAVQDARAMQAMQWARVPAAAAGR